MSSDNDAQTEKGLNNEMKEIKRKIDTYGLTKPFELTYEDRLVAFLDLLGFSNMVQERRDDDVEFVVNLIPDMLRTNQVNILRDDLQITNISDSIIVSVKAKSDEILKDLFNLCVIIGNLQHELALNGYYMRGGISVGKLVHDSERNLIVGPAYIQAYLLESKQSIVPRVVIGKEVEEFYGKNFKQMAEILNNDFTEFYYKGKLITSYSSGHPLWVGDPEIFVDYLSTFVGREKAGFKGTICRFGEHLEKALNSGVACEKYQWLALYALETVDSSDNDINDEGRSCMERIRTMLAAPPASSD
ncbi:hypothetical protein F1728_24325 [Gimesia benthica]|uniref:Uncharacterized protein n=1 Tax=Gimesia benthica TaxID=2608982 RepID=A0A6I6AH94_9PLAN|nr:hypothetical protein [Gimesia benthica]QGQ25618.1 hypothetical protein F1728_24325 [Gimesia benthica]